MNNPQNNTKLPHYDSKNNNKSSLDVYLQTRKDHLYYDFIQSLLMTICRKEDSICDVGSRGVDMLSFLPCKSKKSIDLQYPYSDDETEGIKGDYLEHDLSGLDIITCFQVLEHIKDDKVELFAHKLLDDARIAIISVPYMWPEGLCKYHVQDPVDVDKIISWFGKNPVFLHTVKEKDHRSRIIAVFVKDLPSPSVDLDFWRKNALKTSEDFAKFLAAKKNKS